MVERFLNNTEKSIQVWILAKAANKVEHLCIFFLNSFFLSFPLLFFFFFPLFIFFFLSFSSPEQQDQVSFSNACCHLSGVMDRSDSYRILNWGHFST
jgi:hypothetical protein